jgi:hypothetical protein
VVISKRFDDDNKPVSFASLMDGIDSRHVQDWGTRHLLKLPILKTPG